MILPDRPGQDRGSPRRRLLENRGHRLEVEHYYTGRASAQQLHECHDVGTFLIEPDNVQNMGNHIGPVGGGQWPVGRRADASGPPIGTAKAGLKSV